MPDHPDHPDHPSDPRPEAETAPPPSPPSGEEGAGTRGVEHDPPPEAGAAAPAGGEPPAIPGPPPADTRRRFVMSQLLAGHPTAQMRRDMVDVFGLRLERALLSHVDVVSDSARTANHPGARRILVLEADPEELAAKLPEMTADTVVEPEKPRMPARFRPWSDPDGAAAADAAAGGPGSGSTLRFQVQRGGGEPFAGAAVVVKFAARGGSGSIEAGVRTGPDGAAVVPFDPSLWVPATGIVDPGPNGWTLLVADPPSDRVTTVTVRTLPRSGPFGWWHLLSGAWAYDPRAGEGIRVGVIDTGVGPNPYLDHVVPFGSIVDLDFTPGSEASLDVSDHGTHVAGLIGARPAQGSDHFGGLAPGATLVAARVFGAGRTASQADVALAVDALSGQERVDLINLGLGGESSLIEQDAVTIAAERGTLCIAAAGNGFGAPVLFPAGYPACVAVTALGLPGTFPSDSLEAAALPGPGGFGTGSLFLAAFGSVGPQVLAAAAGNAVISTVPAGGGPVPYAAMSGTAMAAALATATLAAALAADPAYRDLTGAGRSAYARHVLASRALPLGLPALGQGHGLARLGTGS